MNIDCSSSCLDYYYLTEQRDFVTKQRRANKYEPFKLELNDFGTPVSHTMYLNPVYFGCNFMFLLSIRIVFVSVKHLLLPHQINDVVFIFIHSLYCFLCIGIITVIIVAVVCRRVTQVSSDQSAAMMYFVATSPFLGDKRSAYGRYMRFALSTLNITGAPADDVTTDSPGDDVIIRGFHVDFSLVARLPYSPQRSVTYYTVNYLPAIIGTVIMPPP